MSPGGPGPLKLVPGMQHWQKETRAPVREMSGAWGGGWQRGSFRRWNELGSKHWTGDSRSDPSCQGSFGPPAIPKWEPPRLVPAWIFGWFGLWASWVEPYMAWQCRDGGQLDTWTREFQSVEAPDYGWQDSLVRSSLLASTKDVRFCTTSRLQHRLILFVQVLRVLVSRPLSRSPPYALSPLSGRRRQSGPGGSPPFKIVRSLSRLCPF